MHRPKRYPPRWHQHKVRSDYHDIRSCLELHLLRQGQWDKNEKELLAARMQIHHQVHGQEPSRHADRWNSRARDADRRHNLLPTHLDHIRDHLQQRNWEGFQHFEPKVRCNLVWGNWVGLGCWVPRGHEGDAVDESQREDFQYFPHSHKRFLGGGSSWRRVSRRIRLQI